MGLTGLGFKEYDQTLALDDADVIIGKGYANGENYKLFMSVFLMGLTKPALFAILPGEEGVVGANRAAGSTY